MKVDIFSDEWCDLVFEEKNKEYGAYKLRKLENKRILIAIIFASAFFVAVFSFPLILRAITPAAKIKNNDVIKLSSVVIDEPLKIKQPEIIEEQIVRPEQIIKQIKFNNITITTDHNVPDDLVTQDKLKNTPGTFGGKNIEGKIEPGAPAVEPAPIKIEKPDDNKIRDMIDIEKYPQFPGGDEEMFKFIASHLHYPPMARETDIAGKVFIQFVVGKDGKIYDVKILRGIGGGCDEEAVRVIRSMPDWSPGRQNGNPVPVYYKLPVKFTLR